MACQVEREKEAYTAFGAAHRTPGAKPALPEGAGSVLIGLPLRPQMRGTVSATEPGRGGQRAFGLTRRHRAPFGQAMRSQEPPNRRPAERLMAKLGIPVSNDTLLRHLKRHQGRRPVAPSPARVVGVDDWSWVKGESYGTIFVDLERREVLDVLSRRSAVSDP